MIKASRLKPCGRSVLSEALFEEFTEGGLYIPIEAQERYPFIGRVVNIGPKVREDIKPDDLAIFSTEMFDAPNTYIDHFFVLLKDIEEDVRILVTLEVEPYFKEQMDIYKASPVGEDRWIQLQDIQTDVAFKFLASDVKDFGPASVRVSETQKLRYIDTMMFPLLNDEGRAILFYLTDEREIQGVIRNAR